MDNCQIRWKLIVLTVIKHFTWGALSSAWMPLSVINISRQLLPRVRTWNGVIVLLQGCHLVKYLKRRRRYKESVEINKQWYKKQSNLILQQYFHSWTRKLLSTIFYIHISYNKSIKLKIFFLSNIDIKLLFKN